MTLATTAAEPSPDVLEDQVLGERGPAHGPARRFARYASVAIGVTAVPYLYVLWDLFSGRLDLLRTEPYFANFYDLQARAILAGHLWLPHGSIGIEGFIHAGREYTYFGLFPSLLRIPVLLFTHRLDGRLTGPSMLLAWLVTALFASLLIWRVRCLVRGDAPLGRTEAACLGLLAGSVTGGSVVVYLAASPWVYDEDFAWSVALTIASLFALAGLLERPGAWRAAGTGLAVTLTALNRAPTGYGCEIAALLTAAWFLSGRAGPQTRRFGLAALAVCVVPLCLAGAVNTLKFGSPFALPMASQVWTSVNLHRREFLAANGGKAYSFGFLPSTLLAYLSPANIHLGPTFPFVTLPPTPAPMVLGGRLDQTYPTASISASSPLLFIAGCWGLVSVFRRRGLGAAKLLRAPVLGAGAACSGALLWGYIAERYCADFLPLMVLAAAIGVADMFGRIAHRPRATLRGTFAAIGVLAAFGLVANVGIAFSPAPSSWSPQQVASFVSVQQDASNLTGHPLTGTVVHASSLPFFAPAGQLYEIGSCEALYLASGYSYATVPDEQYEHWSWMPLTQGPQIVHQLTIGADPQMSGYTGIVPLVKVGRSEVVLQVLAHPGGRSLVRLVDFDPHYIEPGRSLPPDAITLGAISEPFRMAPGAVERMRLVADPFLDQISVVAGQTTYMSGPYTPGGPLVLQPGTVRSGAAIVSVSLQGVGDGEVARCRSIVSS